MSESVRRGRAHDAEGAREAILDAAEEVFAEHGFDGARVDAIAAAAHYNKSLIFQYFGDKLNLYSEVIRRADRQTRGYQEQLIAAFRSGEITINASTTRGLLITVLRAYFDYGVDHPQFARILLWEMAEGWQTYAKIVTPRDYEDVDEFRPIVQKIIDTGLLRSDFDILAQMIMVEFLVPSFLAMIPLYQVMMRGEDLSSTAAMARARDFIIGFAVNGLLADTPPAAPPDD